MSTDSSLLRAFDLDSEPGVMAVLASIRAGQLSPAEKNELRDLVFAYTNGGRDSSVRIALLHKLNSHKIEPAPIKLKTPPAPTLEFGTYRPTPSFKKPTLKAVEVNPEPVVTVPTPSATEVAQIKVEDTKKPESATTTTSVAPVGKIEPAPTQAPIPAPTPEESEVKPTVSSQIKVETPTPIPTPNPTPVATPAPAPATLSPEVDVSYLNRIREIKTAVNSRVGNPVNLVDIDNTVGREYMNALLEAMKKLSSGAVSEMGKAMERLETAFQAVEITLDKHDSNLVKTEPPLPTVVYKPQAPVSAVQVEPVLDTRVTPPTPLPNLEPVSSMPKVDTAPKPVEEILPPKPMVIEPEEAPLPVRPVIAEVPSYLIETPVKPPPEPEPVRAPMQPMQPMVPVYIEPEQEAKAEGKSLVDLTDVNNIPVKVEQTETVNTVVGGNKAEYFTPEVDAGLQQLLSDWSLFKKSGLFGNGPTGREHPLYKKIADLNVPLLLAGRFEGATQEIRQSITDYMNGWRYEQGIIYKPGETFEIYLRRVIRHILDLQNKRHHS